MNSTIVSTAVGVVAGGLITWFVAWKYYVKAGIELREEADRLASLTSAAMEGQERAGWATLRRDSAGRIVEYHPRLQLGKKTTPPDEGRVSN